MISEELNLSGIITLFCCGFTMNHYTYYNLSEDSKSGSVLAIQTISHFSEASTYVYLGFSLFSIEKENFSITFILTLVGITLASRFFSVVVPMLLLRLCRKKLQYKQQVFIWYAGLIRGAIAYALTYRIDKSLE